MAPIGKVPSKSKDDKSDVSDDSCTEYDDEVMEPKLSKKKKKKT